MSANLPITDNVSLKRYNLDKHNLDNYDWSTSELLTIMQQAMIPISEDIELCVEVGGNPNNPPLLLIMGYGSQLIFWPEAFIRRLIDAGFFVIRYDNRDIGLSTKIKMQGIREINAFASMLRLQFGIDNSKNKVSYLLTDLADDAAHLIKALGLRQTHVLGASMGGMIAQILAAKYPHLVNRLALIFTTNNRPFLPPPRLKQLQTLVKSPASYDRDDIIAHSKWFISKIGSYGHIEEEDIKRFAGIRFDRCFYPRGTINQLDAILTTGSIQGFSQEIKAPTLIMHGTEDGLVPTSQGRALAEDIAGATFVPIKGMAHDLPDYFQPFIVYQIKKHMIEVT